MIIIKAKSMREQVYDNLKELIVNGEIEAGQKIIEEEYAKKYAVSRTPIREALRMLEHDGLVETKEKGGVVVKYISIKEIKEVYQIRIALEGLVLEEIINLKNPNLKKIEKIVKDSEKFLKVDKNNIKIDKVLSLFSKFNSELYELSNLKHITKFIRDLNLYVKRLRRMCLMDEKRLMEAYNEHLELIDAIKRRDIDLALKINKNHLLSSMNFVLKKVEIKEKNKN